jgi:hypothetical protein
MSEGNPVYPGNEAALIVLACQDLDALMKKKYLFIGGAVVAVATLIGISICSLFFKFDWFLCALCCPFLTWYFSEQHVEKLNCRIRTILSFIQYHHQNQLLRLSNIGIGLRSEI